MWIFDLDFLTFGVLSLEETYLEDATNEQYRVRQNLELEEQKKVDIVKEISHRVKCFLFITKSLAKWVRKILFRTLRLDEETTSLDTKDLENW